MDQHSIGEGSLEERKAPHLQIYSMLVDKDEISWQSLLNELIRTEQMDPWDIDVSLLAQHYIDAIKALKEHDFKISGKVLLAAAILLKIKSNRLMGEDIEYLDRLLSQQDEEELLSFEEQLDPRPPEQIPKDLIPRTPQSRRRKVSMQDLMQALERALEVKRRRVLQSIPPLDIKVPEKKRDLSEVIKEIFTRIKEFFWDTSQTSIRFSQLLPSDSKEDKIYTFVPLLHLATQRKVDLHQEKHFDDFEVHLKDEPVQDKEQAKDAMPQEGSVPGQ